MNKEFPVVVWRWFPYGQGLAYAPEVADLGTNILRELAWLKVEPDKFKVDQAFGESRLLGIVSPDPECPDERSRNRGPFVAVMAIVSGMLDESERVAIYEELERIAIPSAPGGYDHLRVRIKMRWSVVRKVQSSKLVESRLGSFFQKKPSGVACLSDHDLLQTARSTESDLFAASCAQLMEFRNLCHPDCLLISRDCCVAVHTPDLTAAAAVSHVVDVDIRQWTFEIRVLAETLLICATNCEQRGARVIHQYSPTPNDKHFRLLRSDVWTNAGL